MRAWLALVCVLALVTGSAPALGGGDPDPEPASRSDRIEELQQELDSLAEDVEDLAEPVEEFELFEECMYVIGVTEEGRAGSGAGYVFEGRRRKRRGALSFDMRGFGRPTYQFLAFPGEEPPSIECNEDAGQEDTDD